MKPIYSKFASTSLRMYINALMLGDISILVDISESHKKLKWPTILEIAVIYVSAFLVQISKMYYEAALYIDRYTVENYPITATAAAPTNTQNVQ